MVLCRRLKWLQRKNVMLLVLGLMAGTFLMKYLKLNEAQNRSNPFHQFPKGALVYHPPLEPHISGKRFTDVRHDTLQKLLDLKPISREEIPKTQLTIVTAASEGFFQHLRTLVTTTQKFLFMKIVVYDIGLTRKQAKKVRSWCNVEYREFNFMLYPPHVKELLSYAFKPLAVMETLKDYPAVLWVDTSIEFTSRDFNEYYKTAQKSNGLVIVHGTGHSIFSVTPPEMFEHLPFVKNAQNTECLVATAIGIFRTQFVINNFLKWWTICALSPSCIWTTEERLCRFQLNHSISAWHDYGYCSRYDQSALTILIENMYPDNEVPPQLPNLGLKINRMKATIEHPSICEVDTED